MFLLKTLAEVIKEPKLAVVMADWIQDFASDKPEADAYIRRLRNYAKLRLTTLIEAVAKFGTAKERHLIRKVVNNSFLTRHGRKKQRRAAKDRPLMYSNTSFKDRLVTQIDASK